MGKNQHPSFASPTPTARRHQPGRPHFAAGLVGGLALASLAPAQSGTWAPVNNLAPDSITVMLLLPDSTVMCASGLPGNQWYRLTPSANGSYTTGTWSTLAPMHDTRLYFQTQVLRDGRVYVSGGEYGTGSPTIEIYDPLTNVWTLRTPPLSMWNPAADHFIDCCSEMLPDGRVLLMPVDPHTSGVGLIYDPATDTWSLPGHLTQGGNQSESTWVKLADDSILTIDPYGTHSERYIAATNTWINDSTVPTSLFDPYLHEIGPGLLLPNGNAFFIGSTGHTAIYTPSGNTAPGTWIAGPNVPNNSGAPDGPAAMLVNGRVLCAVSPAPTSANFPSPTTFYEYDPVANSFAAVAAPSGANWPEPSYYSLFLALPDGNVLHSHFDTRLYVYHPSGTPPSTGLPVVDTISQNSDGSFHLVGTGLNGMSEGASYGDDWQMNSNYPIVQLQSGGAVFRPRSYNWSSTGVQTGTQVVSTEFKLPLFLPNGSYSLTVSASGLTSDPVSFTVPFVAWTDLGNGLAGTNGVPALTATGSVIGDGETNFEFAQCLASSFGICVFGTTAVNLPLFGGVLVPDTEALVAFPIDGSGNANFPVHWFAGITAGLPVYAQGWIFDGVGPQGFAASNAIGTTSL